MGQRMKNSQSPAFQSKFEGRTNLSIEHERRIDRLMTNETLIDPNNSTEKDSLKEKGEARAEVNGNSYINYNVSRVPKKEDWFLKAIVSKSA